MDIINKLKNIVTNIYSNKLFRILFAVMFLIFVLRNYSSVPKHIEKIKDKEKELSIRNLKDKMEIKAFLKEKNNKEKQNKIKNTKKEKTNAEQSVKNDSNIANDGDLVMVQMTLFNKKINKIITKVDEMPIIINNDEINIFAKYLKGHEVGYSIMIPISEISEQPLPENDILYKLSIKSIKSMNIK
ncbi:MAG TPA: hypothetical protein VLL98_02950 [Rickettsiales bacterium]|nr:hypothetical protein [Rickettsiales bacterium]